MLVWQKNVVAVALFACLVIGFAVSAWHSPLAQTQTEQQQPTEQYAANKEGEHRNKTQSLWIPTDSVGLYTLALAVFTALLVGVSAFQGFFLLRADKTARIAANAAGRSADIAEATLIATNRPWISILKVAPISQLTWEEKGARLTVSAVIKNVGKSPAFDVSTEASQFVSNPKQFDIGASVRRYCEDLRQKQIQRASAGQRGDVLFPDDTLPISLELLFNRQEIEACVKAMGNQFFSPVIVICSDYKSPITKTEHSTGLAYMIWKLERGMTSMPKADETMDINDFGLASVPFGSFAD